MPPSAPQWSMHLSRQNKEQCPFQLSKAYVDRRAAGDVAPPIKVDGGVIVEGNHRYIAGRLFGVDPATTAGVMPGFQQSKPAVSWQDIKLDPNDWGNR
jgi:hypothetical protein